jgi:hypothetical protein
MLRGMRLADDGTLQLAGAVQREEIPPPPRAT